ncbi:helix-turn-helix domain-containing protein [Sedimenticola selenatireducens]|uniref:helix-turn-helix domain-containing protein n=1 Tax=Sedimenticola selenatireducens TaxID=191960 RepID=UPI003B588192
MMHYSDPAAFAQRLNSCLSKARVSQLELANRTGLKPSQINHFCCGRRLPNLRNFTKICQSLPAADPRYLMGLKHT